MSGKVVIVVGAKTPSAHEIAKRIAEIDNDKYKVIVMDEASIGEAMSLTEKISIDVPIEIDYPHYKEPVVKIPHLQRGGLTSRGFNKRRFN